MALTIPNVATADGYMPALTLGPVPEAVGIKYVVANASVIAQVAPKMRSGTLGDWGDELLITQETNTLTDCDGIRFKSAVAGQPARIVASLYLPADAKFGAGQPFLATLLASGGLSGAGALITGHVSAAGVKLGGSGFSVVRNGATSNYEITPDVPFTATPVVIAQAIDNAPIVWEIRGTSTGALILIVPVVATTGAATTTEFQFLMTAMV